MLLVLFLQMVEKLTVVHCETFRKLQPRRETVISPTFPRYTVEACGSAPVWKVRNVNATNRSLSKLRYSHQAPFPDFNRLVYE